MATFYEPITDLYYEEELEDIMKAMCELNRKLLSDGHVTGFEVFNALKLPDVFWCHLTVEEIERLERGNIKYDGILLDLDIIPNIDEDGNPAIALDVKPPIIP